MEIQVGKGMVDDLSRYSSEKECCLMEVKPAEEEARSDSVCSGCSSTAFKRQNLQLDQNLTEIRLPELGLPKQSDILTELMTGKDGGSKECSTHK